VIPEAIISVSAAALAGIAGWRLHRATHPPQPAPSIRLRRSTVHEDWEITGATPPVDPTYTSPRWGLPELENR